MPRTLPFSLTLSTFALMAAVPALGLTAEDLWTEWQTQATATGQTMTATEVIAGDGTLTLNGVSTTFSDGEVSTVGRVDRIVMTEAADGTVSVEISERYDFTITFVPDPGTPPVNLGIVLRAPDLDMTASGTPGALVYDYAAPMITIEDGPITGGDGPPPTIDATITLEDVTARYQIDGSDPENIGYDATSSFASMAGAIHILPPPDEVGQMKLVLASGPMRTTGAGRLGNLTDLAANPELVPSGFDLGGSFEYDSLTFEFTFEHPEDGFTVLTSNAGGSLSTTFSEAELAYTVAARDSTTFMSGADIPVPIEYSVGSSEIGFRFPLEASEAAQPVSARVAYEDVILGAGIWAMADPAETFPRDPLTVIADLSGSLRVLQNLMTADIEDMDGPPPVELQQMTLNELRVSAAGATLTGSGSAEFAPGPVPMPVGSVDLQLSGGLALLDTLEAAGLVPIEQLAMVRGMLGAFARPGATPDTLESTIAFTEGGGITANGVPLQ